MSVIYLSNGYPILSSYVQQTTQDLKNLRQTKPHTYQYLVELAYKLKTTKQIPLEHKNLLKTIRLLKTNGEIWEPVRYVVREYFLPPLRPLSSLTP